MGFNKKAKGQCFVAIQGKVKIYSYSQKPNIHYGNVLVEVGVLTEIVWRVYTDPHLVFAGCRATLERGPSSQDACPPILPLITW